MNISTRLQGAARAALAIATVAAGVAVAAPANAQVSINIGQPGFYGQLNIGGYPPPVLYSPRPVVVERRWVGEPVYLRVPEGHRRHWAKHCYRYNACGRQVYFVQDSWYNNTYAPRYRQHHYRERPVVVRENFYREPHRDDHRGPGRGHDRGPDRGHDRGHDRGPDRGHDRGHDDRGHGNGHGNGRRD
ncbi:MAG TPA: hypothetical protein VFU95_14225 [Telluria sp.]|nr:hypothetical protein [Telluria sp.]